jgi:hypothetical protein
MNKNVLEARLEELHMDFPELIHLVAECFRKGPIFITDDEDFTENENFARRKRSLLKNADQYFERNQTLITNFF